MAKKYSVEDWGELEFEKLGALYQCTRSDAWPVLMDLFEQCKTVIALASLENHATDADWHGAKGVKLFVEKCDTLREVIEDSFVEASKPDKTDTE